MTIVEQGGGPAPQAAPDLIKETTTQTFVKDVIEESKRQPVLIDFWAPWCGPCRYTLPNLARWQNAYKGKGLVILGVTKYYGRGGGKELNVAEELVYLRDFRTRNKLPYGFVVEDGEKNEFNYGVFSIPTSFLIDRAGTLRALGVTSLVVDADDRAAQANPHRRLGLGRVERG